MQVSKYAPELDFTFEHAKAHSDGWNKIPCISITIEIYSTYLHIVNCAVS